MTYKELEIEYLTVVQEKLNNILNCCQTSINQMVASRLIGKESSLEIINREIINILSRGLAICNNEKDNVSKNPFLLTGINPSYSGSGVNPWKIDNPFTFQDATTPPPNKKNWPNTYWGKKKKQFGELCESMAYFDLFPLRETNQNTFERVFKQENIFRGRLLEISQKHIEELAPKLIVHANRDSMYYWGINKNADGEKVQYNNTQDPWMGYKVERVNKDDRLPKCFLENGRYERFPFYKITGMIHSNNRINQDIIQTRLEGSYIIEYVMEYRSKEDKGTLFSDKEWEKIWEWVNQNYHK